MKNARKPISIGIAVAALAILAGCADAATPYANSGGNAPSSAVTPVCGGGRGMMGDGYGPMMGRGRGLDMGMMGGYDMSARLDAVKSQLGIRADQEAAWNGYAKAVGDAQAGMLAFRQGRGASADMTPQDRQTFMLQMHQQRQEAWQAVTTAGQTLLASLDDAQKVKAQQNLPGFGVCGARPGGAMMGCGGFARP